MDLYIRGIVYHVGEVGWGRDHLNTLVAKALAGFEAKFGGQHAAHDDFIKYIMDHYAKRPGARAPACAADSYRHHGLCCSSCIHLLPHVERHPLHKACLVRPLC